MQGAPGRKTLVVFSDGEDTRSTLGLNELIEVIRSSSVTIYPIAFSGGFPAGSSRAAKSRAFLQHIAGMTGGQVLTPHSSRELGTIYERILSELGAQYVLGFLSSNTLRDGQFRRLKVEVKRPGLKIRHRAGYYAPVARRPRPDLPNAPGLAARMRHRRAGGARPSFEIVIAGPGGATADTLIWNNW